MSETEGIFRRLFELAPDGLIVVDGEGQIVLVNAQAEKLFGYRREELLGKGVELLVPEHSRSRHVEEREAYSAMPSLRPMGNRPELNGIRKDGSEFAADISLSPIVAGAGRLVCAAVRDITERKKAEAALRESEERFELALRGADAGTWDWDLRTNKVHYGPRWKSMLGYAEDEITDDYLEWETRIHSDDRDHALATVRDYLEGRTASYELEHRLRHVDGTYRSILARAPPSAAVTGNRIGWWGGTSTLPSAIERQRRQRTTSCR